MCVPPLYQLQWREDWRQGLHRCRRQRDLTMTAAQMKSRSCPDKVEGLMSCIIWDIIKEKICPFFSNLFCCVRWEHLFLRVVCGFSDSSQNDSLSDQDDHRPGFSSRTSVEDQDSDGKQTSSSFSMYNSVSQRLMVRKSHSRWDSEVSVSNLKILDSVLRCFAVKIPNHFSHVTIQAKMGFREGEGLGKFGQGRREIVEASTQRGRRGLGLTLQGFQGELNVDWRDEPEVQQPIRTAQKDGFFPSHPGTIFSYVCLKPLVVSSPGCPAKRSGEGWVVPWMHHRDARFWGTEGVDDAGKGNCQISHSSCWLRPALFF